MTMNQKLLSCGIVILATVAGCIPSLNPAYQEENLVFNSTFVGVWSQPNSKAKWNFSKRNDKSYTLAYQDEEGRQGRFIGHLANIEGTLFLDLFPEDTNGAANGFYKFHLVPIHTIYLVRETKSGLKLAAIDYKWLDKYLTEHGDEIATATFDGRKLITAPTEDVQKFLVKHREEFHGDFDLVRESAAAK
jgi:hypothetical protein